MKKIYFAFRRLLSSSYLLLIVFLQCDDSECTKDLRIVKVLPNRNPIAAPILIKGKSFSKSTKVTFKEIESEITFVNDSTITTSAPIELKETLGLVELRVFEGNCSITTEFTLTRTFEDPNRVSPPTIFFPNPSKKVSLSIQDFACGWFNIWGGNQTLNFSFSAANYYGVVPDKMFIGTEFIFSTQTKENNPLVGSVKADKSIEIKTWEDNLEGEFYETTLLTMTGMESGTFLFLQSTISGRQYIFGILDPNDQGLCKN